VYILQECTVITGKFYAQVFSESFSKQTRSVAKVPANSRPLTVILGTVIFEKPRAVLLSGL
jgi:hypothetical protein